MAIEAVKIPTNIQVEERIIGPLSLRQIAILLLTAGFSYGIWSIATTANPQLNVIAQALCYLPFLIGIAFSFIHVNGVSLFSLVLLTLEKFDKPTKRTYGPRSGLSINIKTGAKVEPQDDTKTSKPQANFDHLGSVLDAGLTREAEEQQKPLEHSAVLDAIQAPTPTEPSNSVTIEQEPTTEPKHSNDDEDDTPPSLIRDIHPA